MLAGRAGSRIARLRALGPHKPRLSVGFALPRTPPGGYRKVFALPRPLPVIAILAVVLIGLCVPLYGVSGMLDRPGGDGLFSLVSTLFVAFWMLGWGVGVAVVALALLCLLTAREVVLAWADGIRVRIEVLGFGIGGEYDARYVSGLRREQPERGGGTAWRGEHLSFDYHGVPVGFGVRVDEAGATEILGALARHVRLPDPAAAAAASADALATAPLSDSDPVSADPAVPTAAIRGRPAPMLRSPSTLALVLANLVPVAGVLALGWSVGEIMLLYWAESAIIGLFNVAKLVVVARWGALAMVPFFVGHYGGFMTVHLLFIFGFFLGDPAAGTDVSLAVVGATFVDLWPALLALVVSHAVSFALNFIGRREFAGRSAREQMGAPYRRIIAMHLTIILGGFLVLAFKAALPALLLLIAIKLSADVRAHLGEHASTS